VCKTWSPILEEQYKLKNVIKSFPPWHCRLVFSGMSPCVIGSVAQDVLKGCSAFIFRQSKTLYSHAAVSGYVSPHTKNHFSPCTTSPWKWRPSKHQELQSQQHRVPSECLNIYCLRMFDNTAFRWKFATTRQMLRVWGQQHSPGTQKVHICCCYQDN